MGVSFLQGVLQRTLRGFIESAAGIFTLKLENKKHGICMQILAICLKSVIRCFSIFQTLAFSAEHNTKCIT